MKRHEQSLAPSGPVQVSGYVVTWGDTSQRLAWLAGQRARVQRGAFARVLRQGACVEADLDHDSGRLLGSTRSGNLRLWEDSIGLAFTLRLCDDHHGREAGRLALAGRLAGVSMHYVGALTRYFQEGAGAEAVRVLTDVELDAVSLLVVKRPAYRSTREWLRVERVRCLGLLWPEEEAALRN